MSLWIFKNFLKKSECAEMSEWAENAAKQNLLGLGVHGINPVSYGLQTNLRLTSRNSFPEQLQKFPDIVYKVRQAIEKKVGIENLKHSWQGGHEGIIVNYCMPGGDLYEHYDPMEDYFTTTPLTHCLRLNIVTQMPEKGGVLHVNGHPVHDLEEGDLHGYVASLYPHGVTKVEGKKNRVCWMFGYQLPNHSDDYERWSGRPKETNKDNI